jgi:hypothetical protein
MNIHNNFRIKNNRRGGTSGGIKRKTAEVFISEDKQAKVWGCGEVEVDIWWS